MREVFGLLLVALVATGQRVRGGTFTNPLLASGPDPWSFQKDGWYYYMNTTWLDLTIARTRNLADLSTAESKVVWRPPATGPLSQELWAPEIHFLDSKWYIYVSGDDGDNYNHRLWVLENASLDPLEGNWTVKGCLYDAANDFWAIDGTVFEYGGTRYALWSGWLGQTNGQQNIFIAPMKNPWTLAGSRVLLSSPTQPWERLGSKLPGPPGPHNTTNVYVNEGPQILQRGKRLYIVYSANGCWTDYYCLGALSFSGTDVLDPSSWSKMEGPLFATDSEAGVYAPGHNSFFTSPDGAESWILYHANPKPNAGCGWLRSPRAQIFKWDSDDTPLFGTPVPSGVPIARPSG